MMCTLLTTSYSWNPRNDGSASLLTSRMLTSKTVPSKNEENTHMIWCAGVHQIVCFHIIFATTAAILSHGKLPKQKMQKLGRCSRKNNIIPFTVYNYFYLTSFQIMGKSTKNEWFWSNFMKNLSILIKISLNRKLGFSFFDSIFFRGSKIRVWVFWHDFCIF